MRVVTTWTLQKDSLMRLYKCGPWGRDGAIMTGSLDCLDLDLLKALGSFRDSARYTRAQFKISCQVSDGDKAVGK